jgi:hypothetical protein
MEWFCSLDILNVAPKSRICASLTMSARLRMASSLAYLTVVETVTEKEMFTGKEALPKPRSKKKASPYAISFSFLLLCHHGFGNAYHG